MEYEFPKEKLSLKKGENKIIDFYPLRNKTALSEITVTGKTKAQQVRETPYNVTAIDATKLHNATTDINQVLNRTTGIKIRETGGMGSGFSFSLNGFSGNQVRFFIDGIPMDNLGSSFQINNIPVNLAERIDVYKGVVPISLGADILGGAINIITNPGKKNFIDASYSYGPFNTHRTSVNTSYTTRQGVNFQLSVSQNYSDNNYKVNIEVADLVTGEYIPMRVKRFHDTYHNETVIAKAGLVNKPFADILQAGITLGQNIKDIQTGNRMYEVYGMRMTKGNIIMPSVRYSKNNLFVEGLDFNLNGNCNLGEEQSIDTVPRQYNWLGDYVVNNSSDSRGVKQVLPHYIIIKITTAC
ncbi:MAG: TonB-dependent receptor plug domain-containing protein [Tannerellaceae bacterium]|jgi:outer membrane receptor for Fe3+-dicitrate|nr:TonB-dependent receptor plug domain-containing protein [Tannerellaceae bacterium]